MSASVLWENHKFRSRWGKLTCTCGIKLLLPVVFAAAAAVRVGWRKIAAERFGKFYFYFMMAQLRTRHATPCMCACLKAKLEVKGGFFFWPSFLVGRERWATQIYENKYKQKKLKFKNLKYTTHSRDSSTWQEPIYSAVPADLEVFSISFGPFFASQFPPFSFPLCAPFFF